MHVMINAGDERQLYPHGSLMSSLVLISTIMVVGFSEKKALEQKDKIHL